MLPEAIEGESDRKDEKDRHDVEFPRNPRTADDRNGGQNRELKKNRCVSLAPDQLLQLRFVRDGLFFCGPKINRKECRSEVERLEPTRVFLRREVVALRILFVRPEGGVMIEVP